MKNIIYIAICSCFLIGGLQAQNAQLFYERLDEVSTFDEAMRIINAEYEALPQEIRDNGGQGYRKEKHWRRWEYWVSSHLGPNGEFVNHNQLNQEALKHLPPPLKTTNSSWASLGPEESTYQNSQGWCIGNGIGRVDRIAFHPSNANIIYAGMPAGGLWRTTDGGTTWESLTNYTASLGISGICVSHSNANTIYVLSGDGDSDISGGFVKDFGYLRPSAGVFKSTDNGATWQQTGAMGAGSYVGFELVMDPNNSNTLYAATSDGLWKTTNGGTSWTQIRTGRIWDVEIKPGSSTRIYCSTDSNFQYSNNGGSTWTNATYNINPPSGRKSITVTNDNSNVVYIFCGPGGSSGNGTFGGFYRSTNSGSSFTRQANTPNICDASNGGTGDDDISDYCLCSAAAHDDEDIIITGSLICFKSTNKGVTWNNASTYWEDGGAWYVHPDIHEMKYNPLDNKVYVGHDGGIHVSSNDGTSWTNITEGIRTTQSYHMDQAVGTTRLLLGNQDNGVKYRQTGASGGTNFPHIASGDGFDQSFDPNDNTRWLCTINRSTYVFSSSGDTRGSINPVNNWYKTVQIDNTNSSVFIVGSNDIYRSTNSGSSWANEGASGSWALTSCPSNNSKYYATGRTSYQPSSLGKAYVSTDDGVTWTDLSGNSGFPTTITKLTDISAEPDNSNHVWMTCGGYNAGSKVYYSSNSGSTWTNMSGGLPNVPVHCVAVSEDNDAFIGTDIGVFYRSNTMTDWIPWSNGLANTPVTDIRLDHSVGSGNIYIATFGRGVWWDNIPNNICDVNVTVSTDLNGYSYYEASEQITSTSEIEGTEGVTTFFQAGERVILNPGFLAEENTVFEASIGPCGNGGIPTADDDTTTPSQKRNEAESDGNEDLNLSKFEILPTEVELYIKESGVYTMKLFTEQYEELETIHSDKYGEGTHRFDVNLDEYRNANSLYYLILYAGNDKVYLQEIY